MFKRPISRRRFIKYMLASAALFPYGGNFAKKAHSGPPAINGRTPRKVKGEYDLVLARGDDPYRMTVKAVEAMGGMDRFVKKGDTVVIKPNMAWDRPPEYAANTNPAVIAALAELCIKAGAGRVNVFDRPCNAAERCYETSGIREAALKAGAKVYYVDDWDFIKAGFPYESPMEEWPVYRDAVECDVFINVPILKDHGLTGLTLSMKNLMGVCGGNRAFIHSDIARKLVDLTDFIKPDLTVIDAYRVLVRNGPSGGSLEDVRNVNRLIVATDPLLADIYACRVINHDPSSVPYIAEASRRNLWMPDAEKAKIFEFDAAI